jgi:superfamily II DNA helicase RecQ
MVPGLKPRRCQIPLPAQNRCTADLKCCNERHSKSTAKPQTLLQRAPHKSSNRPHTPQQTVAQTCRESRCSWCRSNRIDFQTCCCVQNRPQECSNTNNTQLQHSGLPECSNTNNTRLQHSGLHIVCEALWHVARVPATCIPAGHALGGAGGGTHEVDATAQTLG